MSNLDRSSLQWKPLLVNLFIPLAVGGLSAYLIRDSIKLYPALDQPPLAPPGWAFPVVWTLFYILMGIAAYLVWIQGGAGRKEALFWYGLQLVCNFIWPLIFFNKRQYAIAFFWLLGLLLLIGVTAGRFFKESPPAGWLLVPYLFWTAFAGYLNLGVWLLNPPAG